MSKRSTPVDSQTHIKSKRSKTSTSEETQGDMASLQSTKRILVVGLAGRSPGHAKRAAPTKAPRGNFRQMLQDTTTKAKEAGLELEMVQYKASAFTSALQDLKERLRSKPDGLLIGNGIRGTAEYTVFFEDLVNACREITPETRMAFNTSPDDILECCLRNFK